jgi:hypothetical protein
MSETGKNVLVLCFIMLLFFEGVTPVPTITSPASEFFCFICFLLVVLKILAKFLYFRRDCRWAFLKCRVCSHEVAVVSESHCQSRFESLNHYHICSFCSVLFCLFAGFGLMKFSWVVISGRPMKKFESGYTVETVFDGSKFGIEPLYSVQVLPSGEFFFII